MEDDLYNISGEMNFTNDTEHDYKPYADRPETYIVPVLFALIFGVGVLGNGTLVVVFMRHRAMRNVPNTYILSLALADLLVLITTVPFTSTVYTVDSWPWGSAMCRISESGKDVSIGVSVFTLTALSADRFFAIVDPLRRLHATGGSRHATRTTITTAVAIWIFSIICAVPAFIDYDLLPVSGGVGCVVSEVRCAVQVPGVLRCSSVDHCGVLCFDGSTPGAKCKECSRRDSGSLQTDLLH